ncbi:hypothetical protein [Peribacillus loiseleuriae]|uniref:hypothetical protein n=1 Tax=Peribacillus loiseleuriae TaxID=1679170 RepID=UPI000B00B631|nr:hypothetical protein [Peribacillus loiseleuriae]
MRRIVKGNKVGGYTRPPIGGKVLLDPGTGGHSESLKPPIGGIVILEQGVVRP